MDMWDRDSTSRRRCHGGHAVCASPGRPESPLLVPEDSVRALIRAADTGVLPPRRDPSWRQAPWALIDPEVAAGCLATLGPGSTPPVRRLRLAALMALGTTRLPPSIGGVSWVVTEWLRCLHLRVRLRETIGWLVRAVQVQGSSRNHTRWRARLAACVNMADTQVLVPALGVREQGSPWRECACPPAYPQTVQPWRARSLRWARIELGAARARALMERTRPGPVGHLWLLVGIPASGKTHWATRRGLQNRVCMDDIRRHLTGDVQDQSRNDEVFRHAVRELRVALASGLEVAFDATNVTPEARRMPLAIAASTGARVTSVFFDTSLHVCVTRNAARERRVPPSAMLRFAQHLVPPMPHEHDARLVVR